jgi:hypothetical protein
VRVGGADAATRRIIFSAIGQANFGLASVL